MKSETENGIRKDLSPSSSPRTSSRFPHEMSNLSNNASANQDEITLIREKPKHHTLTVPANNQIRKRMSKEERPKKYSVEIEQPPIVLPTLKKQLEDLMNGKMVEVIVLGLIFIYILLVFIETALDNDCEPQPTVKNITKALMFIEAGILTIFLLEVFFRVMGSGAKEYFCNYWNLLDLGLLLITVGLVVSDLSLEENEKMGSLRRIRGFLRLSRVLVLLRKANEASRIRRRKTTTTHVGFRSPVEKVLELFETLKGNTKDKNLKKDIEWAMEVVSTNKLYETILESNDSKKSDANLWVKSYNPLQNNNPKEKSENGSRRLSIMPTMAIFSRTKSNSAFIMKQAVLDTLSKNVNEFHFDIFDFKRISHNEELTSMLFFLFDRQNFFDTLNIKQETFIKFAKKIQSGYLDNPYHNQTHAADVLQTTNYFLTTGEFVAKTGLNHLEVASVFIAAAVHDFDHPGTNNAFHINTGSPYAIKYNDKSVLENHHVSSVFAILNQDSYNIFANFSREDYKMIRERIVSIVLATDMSIHFSDIAKLKGRLAADIDIKDKDKKFIMEVIVHAADISNPSKPWDTCKEWTLRVVKEFFDQGDKERALGLPVSHLCDRYTTNLAKSQIGFIDFVVSPLFVLLKEIFPKIDISGFEINKGKWKDLVDYYEEELKDLGERRKALEAKAITDVSETKQ